MINILFYNILSQKVDALINEYLLNCHDISIYSTVDFSNKYIFNVEIVSIDSLEIFIKEKNVTIVVLNSLGNLTKNIMSSCQVISLCKQNTNNVKHIKELSELLVKLKREDQADDVSLKINVSEKSNIPKKENDTNIVTKTDNLDNNTNIYVSKEVNKEKLSNSETFKNTPSLFLSILIQNIIPAKTMSLINEIFMYLPKNIIAKVYSTAKIDNPYNYDIETVNITDTAEFIINNNVKILIVNGINKFSGINNIGDKCKILTLCKYNSKLLTHISELKNVLFNLNNENCTLLRNNHKNMNMNVRVNVNVNKNLNKNLNKNIVKQKIDDKEVYRNICNTYLENIRNIKIQPLKLNLEKETVLIEFRILEHLECLVRNTIINVGNNWSHTIICGNLNYEYVCNFSSKISNNIKIIKLNYDNLTHNQYNNFMLSNEIWDLLIGEKILIYQEDSCIFKNNIDDFLNYDYIGAPFGPSCVMPINVGNGGFSLRSKSVMKKSLEICNPANFNTTSSMVNNYRRHCNLEMFPEDIYYPQVIQDNALGIVAPVNVASNFSSEHTYNANSLGMHCLWFCNRQWKNVINDYFKQMYSIFSNDANENANVNANANVNNCKFNVYIIHPEEFTDREELIQKNISELKNQFTNVDVKIFKSINTTKCDSDVDSQIKILKKWDKNLDFNDVNKFTFYKPGQIGCYLGHHLAIKEIMENNEEGYSIILEDDASFSTNFYNNICRIMDYFNLTNDYFDIIYLGSLNNNRGTKKYNNIYNINKKEWLFGAQGLLINNQSAQKLYNYNCTILHEIDNQYKLLMNNDLIKGYYISPSLVIQKRNILKSYIGFHT